MEILRKILTIYNKGLTWVLSLQAKNKPMLEKEFKYYVDHQTELVKKYNGKYIVIVGSEVVHVYDDESTAYLESVKVYSEGTFLIQLCQEGKDSFTQNFHSRVIFA
jgi:hypothetical protein